MFLFFNTSGSGTIAKAPFTSLVGFADIILGSIAKGTTAETELFVQLIQLTNRDWFYINERKQMDRPTAVEVIKYPW